VIVAIRITLWIAIIQWVFATRRKQCDEKLAAFEHGDLDG
jgi:hypothetical protein